MARQPAAWASGPPGNEEETSVQRGGRAPAPGPSGPSPPLVMRCGQGHPVRGSGQGPTDPQPPSFSYRLSREHQGTLGPIWERVAPTGGQLDFSAHQTGGAAGLPLQLKGCTQAEG